MSIKRQFEGGKIRGLLARQFIPQAFRPKTFNTYFKPLWGIELSNLSFESSKSALLVTKVVQKYIFWELEMENEEEKRENSKAEEDREDKFKEKLQQVRENEPNWKKKRVERKNGQWLKKD